MNSRIHLLAAVACGLLLAPAAAAQRLIIVDASGGGAFTAINPAIESATHGDTILVRAGSYQSFRVDRGVSVIGEGVVLLTAPVHYPSVTIAGVPAGQTAAVRGFIGFPFISLMIEDNDGAVHVQGMGLPSRVLNNRSLTLRRLGTGRGSLTITSSNVVLQQCNLTLGNQITVERSNVTIAECVIRRMANPFFQGPVAVVNGNSTLTIAGAADSVLAAYSSGTPYPVIDVTLGTVVLEPAVTLEPAFGAPAVRGGTLITRHVPSMSVDVAGGTFSTRVHAAQALRAHTLLSLPLLDRVPTPFGDLWVSTSNFLLDSGTVPASGFRTHAFAVPLGLPPGLTVAVQALVAQPTGIELSTVAVVGL
jgi:hypothetical protein